MRFIDFSPDTNIFLYVSYHHTQSVREKFLSHSEDALSKRELPKSNSEQMQFNRVLP